MMHEDRVQEYFKDAKILRRVGGRAVEGLEYDQPFDYFEKFRAKGYFKGSASEFVTDMDGTGIVHCAPGF